MSSIVKFDAEKFDGSNDFGLWRVKMRCLLIQHGWEAVEVNKEDSVAGFWLKLETLYMTKYLANKLYLKRKLFTFYMHSGIHVITSLPPSYDNSVETLLYGRESLTLEDVLSSLNSRELKKRTDAKDDGDGLYVRGRSDHRDCPKRNKKKSTVFVKKNARQGSGMHSEGYDNGDFLMAVSEERFLEWIMDSGGSFHMTPRRDFLFDFKEYGGTILLGDNRACAIMGIGKVRVHIKNGSSFVLENVCYIPELKRNLISLGTLDRKGYIVKLQNGRVKVIKGSLMVLLGTMKENCMYSLDGWVESGKASVGIQEKESLAQVWHKRLGHISEAGLHELEKRKVIGNKGLGKLEFCETYVLGKSTREFNNLCKKSGIARHLTVARTPQQNGLAERMNKVRCLLIQSGLPDLFWAEATVTATYLINRSPSTALEKKLPMDLWSRHLTNYEMLRIFGCVAYSHRLDDVKPKIIISKDVVFNESLMYKDTLKGVGAADSGKEVEFEVELQGSRVEPTVDPYTGENPGNEDEEQDEEPQQQNLDNYVLVHDRAKRATSIPARYRDEGNVLFSRPSGYKIDDMTAYALAIAEKEDTHEPITFQEAINSSDKDEWVRAMEKEMSSLIKNHTWELVDQPPSQKLVSCKWLYRIKEGIEGVQKPRVILSLIACEDYEFEQLDVKTAFLHDFDMKELGLAKKILGMKIVRDRGSRILKVSQSGYVQKILNDYRVDNGKSVSVPLGAHFKVSLKGCPSSDWDVKIMSKVPYANVVGSLMYLMVCTRPDIAYAVSIVSRDQGKHVDIDGFVDADYAKDPDKGTSITGYVFMLRGCVVSWKATLQHVVALSTIEAEYMALTEAVKESIGLKRLLIELGVNLREIVKSKEIKLAKIGTKDNACDTFTKVVPRLKFKYCMEILGVGII
uniref:Uncharacterized protein n=1 Tax=Tanacetum cinerariifolium TaxID=118510 RepID=A0A699I428_TANCI|nr:hypothetical protein [Tanacetum cinerariifolium]